MKRCPSCDEDLSDEELDMGLCLSCGDLFDEKDIQPKCQTCDEPHENDSEDDEICPNCREEEGERGGDKEKDAESE
jgi:Zn finger protein HypA/HybF involved in hydrogenase expression